MTRQEQYAKLAVLVEAVYIASEAAKQFADDNDLYFTLDEDRLKGIEDLINERDSLRNNDWNSSGSYVC